MTAGDLAIRNPDIVRANLRTTAPDYQITENWLLPTFQSHWLNEANPFGLWNTPTTAGFGLRNVFDETASTSSFFALSRSTSPQMLVTARLIADNLRAQALSITEWVEDREYEEQFLEVVEPVPTGWLKQLSRFTSGPEIAFDWDEDE